VANITLNQHFQRLIRLLELEAEAEKQEALRDLQHRSPAVAETSSSTLINLVIREEAAGLGGRILLRLGNRNHTPNLPWTRLGISTLVILIEEGKQTGAGSWRRVVSRVFSDCIQIAFSEWPEPESERLPFRLDRFSDEIPLQRQLYHNNLYILWGLINLKWRLAKKAPDTNTIVSWPTYITGRAP
jgi:hypothetical protein